MNKKGIRRYGKLGFILRRLKYGLHVGILMIAVVVLFFIGVIALCAVAFTPCAALISQFNIVLTLAYLLGSLAAVAGCGWFLHRVFTVPKGHILHPMPPTENPILPEEELLVRASSSTEAQPAELLRATQARPDEKPEELLRKVE